ncbi:MAG: hypothetical protein ACK4OO_02620, partial [bacterium]
MDYELFPELDPLNPPGSDRGEKPNTWHWIVSSISTLDVVGGVKPFPQWHFLEELVQIWEDYRLVLVAKSRQMMVTWTVLATMLYRCFTQPPGVYLLLSKGARDSGELVKRLKVMVQHLPDQQRERVKVKAEEVCFDTGSRILALPAAEYAPRMHSPAGVVWDEMAFTPHDEEIWAGVQPAVQAGGWFIGISTPNGTDNLFYRLFTGSAEGFYRHRLHYRHHPQRNREWLLQAQAGLSQMRWRQEYEIDFFAMSERVFDEFSPDLHLLTEPFHRDRDQGKIVRGVDFGYRHPYVLWGQLLPQGDL